MVATATQGYVCIDVYVTVWRKMESGLMDWKANTDEQPALRGQDNQRQSSDSLWFIVIILCFFLLRHRSSMSSKHNAWRVKL